MDSKVEEWLASYSAASTRMTYASSIKRFLQYCGKTGDEIIEEARQYWHDPDKADIYALKAFQYGQHLLACKVKETGSRGKGTRGGATGKLKQKTLSRLTAKHAVTVVQAFFQFYNMPLNMRKFSRKDAKMRRPHVERKKHQLTQPEIQKLMQVADARDRALLALGLMGQDESTVAALTVEQFEGKLEGKNLEIVELVRPKTNAEIYLVLTPEVQGILKMYLGARTSGWVFPGYNKNHMIAAVPNKIFHKLCGKAGLTDNGKRLSFHCCRLWFSAQLRNRISDDIIDMLTGHVLRFNGAYVPNNLEEFKKTLIDAKIGDLLQFESHPSEVISGEIEKLKNKVARLEQENQELVRAREKQQEKVESLEGLLRRVEELEKKLGEK